MLTERYFFFTFIIGKFKYIELQTTQLKITKKNQDIDKGFVQTRNVVYFITGYRSVLLIYRRIIENYNVIGKRFLTYKIKRKIPS